MTKKMENKYIPLATFFRNTLQDELVLTYEALENIMGQQLPNAAYLNSSWWTKTKSPLQHYLAWLEADFIVTNVQLGHSITFTRNHQAYTGDKTAEQQPNILIRPIDLLDARPFINMKRELYATSPFEYYTHEEYDVSVQLMKKQMAHWKVLGNSTILLAIVDGVHAGFVEIFGGDTIRTKHRAQVRVGVLSPFQRQHVASMLMDKCFIWAKAHGITKLEAQIVAQNEAAVQLLQKHSFVTEGTRQQAVYINETYYDELYVSKLL